MYILQNTPISTNFAVEKSPCLHFPVFFFYHTPLVGRLLLKSNSNENEI